MFVVEDATAIGTFQLNTCIICVGSVKSLYQVTKFLLRINLEYIDLFEYGVL